MDAINLQSLLLNKYGHVMINEFCEDEPVTMLHFLLLKSLEKKKGSLCAVGTVRVVSTETLLVRKGNRVSSIYPNEKKKRTCWLSQEVHDHYNQKGAHKLFCLLGKRKYLFWMQIEDNARFVGQYMGVTLFHNLSC